MVFSCKETFSIDLRAASDAFRMASETSFALPNPQPTIPSWSPATIRALKLKRRPPFTPFAQRLMKTTFSVVSPLAAGVLSVLRSGRLPGFDRAILKFQPAAAPVVRQRFHFAMDNISAAIKHHVLSFFGEQFLRDRFTDALRRLAIRRCFFSRQILLQSRNRGQRFAGIVVNDLRVNVVPGKIDSETRSFRRSAHFFSDALVNALAGCLSIRRHLLHRLAFLAPNLLARVTHALSLVGLGRIISANISSYLAHQLLIDATNR